jgi:hypothetical protein
VFRAAVKAAKETLCDLRPNFVPITASSRIPCSASPMSSSFVYGP